MGLHPQVLRRGGKEEFVVLPYEEFLEIQERLADAEDLLELRQAKREEGDHPSVSLPEVKKQFRLSE